MQLLVSKKIIFILILSSFIGYSVYITNNPTKLADIETKYTQLGNINTKIKEITGYIFGKTTDTTTKSKELYDSKLAPKVDSIKTGVQKGIDTTKSRVDNVRKTLSGAEDTYNKTKEVINDGKETLNKATEVLNDIDKMGNSIINTVNTGTVSETFK